MPEPAIRPIRILSDDTARRIAAGEVIDRPAAVLRELLDNAIDAGAGEITCYLEDGGNERIRVQDNGRGMSPGDLALCGRPHATSKIVALEDLDRLATLGFRGEALSSIAACSRLEISSTAAGAPAGRKLIIEGGAQTAFESTGPLPGTTVDVSRIFFNMPARKRFLKRPQTEGMLCRAVFVEKALAHPAVAFRLWSDGKMILFLPHAPLADRIALAHDRAFPAEFLETHTAAGEGFRLTTVASGPEAARQDRKYIQIYVNRRRIHEFSLLQAVEYGYDGYLPGGRKPIAFVFIDIDPALAYFNIHPAKREARFRNLPELRAALIACLKSFLQTKRALPPVDTGDQREAASLFTGADIENDRHSPLHVFSRPGFAEILKTAQREAAGRPAETSAQTGLRYLGQAWQVYLAGVLGDEIILVDQHAAHERLLFDELCARPLVREKLAIPVAFELEADESAALEAHREALENMGFVIHGPAGRTYELDALPSALAAVPEANLVDFLKGARGDADELMRSALALGACRAAIKEGAPLDPVSACELMHKALALPDPRCPHGRPVIVRLTRAALDKFFQRTV
jgi:DNA mismatch repair protein MutL